ncbi:hypothetical protein HDU83_006288 [Entophlyctis luteolus]|nr:hypothetical protein HDU83_006288 [Entophlyctis luteolus]
MNEKHKTRAYIPQDGGYEREVKNLASSTSEAVPEPVAPQSELPAVMTAAAKTALPQFEIASDNRDEPSQGTTLEIPLEDQHRDRMQKVGRPTGKDHSSPPLQSEKTLALSSQPPRRLMSYSAVVAGYSPTTAANAPTTSPPSPRQSAVTTPTPIMHPLPTVAPHSAPHSKTVITDSSPADLHARSNSLPFPPSKAQQPPSDSADRLNSELRQSVVAGNPIPAAAASQSNVPRFASADSGSLSPAWQNGSGKFHDKQRLKSGSNEFLADENYRKSPRDVSLKFKPTGQTRFKEDMTLTGDYEAVTGLFSLDSFDFSNEVTFPLGLSEDLEQSLTTEITNLCKELLPTKADVLRRIEFVEKIQHLVSIEWPDKDIRVHAFGNLSCDINVNNVLALRNTALMKAYVDLDARVRPFITVVKHWAKQRMLNDAAKGGTLSSYCWVIMAVNFLQTRTPPVLPSLQKIYLDQLASVRHPNSGDAVLETVIVEGVDCSFAETTPELKRLCATNTSSVGALLYSFFRFYACEFSYPTQVVSVRHGALLSKHSKSWDVDVERMCRHLCVEEPLTPDRNLANSADATAVAGLRSEFRRVLELLLKGEGLEAACEPYYGGFGQGNHQHQPYYQQNYQGHQRGYYRGNGYYLQNYQARSDGGGQRKLSSGKFGKNDNFNVNWNNSSSRLPTNAAHGHNSGSISSGALGWQNNSMMNMYSVVFPTAFPGSTSPRQHFQPPVQPQRSANQAQQPQQQFTEFTHNFMASPNTSYFVVPQQSQSPLPQYLGAPANVEFGIVMSLGSNGELVMHEPTNHNREKDVVDGISHGDDGTIVTSAVFEESGNFGDSLFAEKNGEDASLDSGSRSATYATLSRASQSGVSTADDSRASQADSDASSVPPEVELVDSGNARDDDESALTNFGGLGPGAVSNMATALSESTGESCVGSSIGLPPDPLIQGFAAQNWVMSPWVTSPSMPASYMVHMPSKMATSFDQQSELQPPTHSIQQSDSSHNHWGEASGVSSMNVPAAFPPMPVPSHFNPVVFWPYSSGVSIPGGWPIPNVGGELSDSLPVGEKIKGTQCLSYPSEDGVFAAESDSLEASGPFKPSRHGSSSSINGFRGNGGAPPMSKSQDPRSLKQLNALPDQAPQNSFPVSTSRSTSKQHKGQQNLIQQHRQNQHAQHQSGGEMDQRDRQRPLQHQYQHRHRDKKDGNGRSKSSGRATPSSTNKHSVDGDGSRMDANPLLPSSTSSDPLSEALVAASAGSNKIQPLANGKRRKDQQSRNASSA